MDLFRTRSITHESQKKQAAQSKREENGGKGIEKNGNSESVVTPATDDSTVLSVPIKSNDVDSASNVEYSADIRPLTFNVSRSMLTKEAGPTADAHFRNSLSKVKEKLSKNHKTYNKPDAMIKSLFGSIDREQFEDYLREPHYIKMLKRGKNLKQFRRLFLAQEIVVNDSSFGENSPRVPSLNSEAAPNAIWVTRFSQDGNYMASGGKDGVLRLWKVIASPLERWHLDFTEENIQALKNKAILLKQQASPGSAAAPLPNCTGKDTHKNGHSFKTGISNLYAPVFHPTPFSVFKHHTADILDINWSKNNFIVTASMDKSVCLWHPERDRPLKSFMHPDFVTCVAFHPTDDRFLITGCLDHKCRLWSILDDEVSFEFDCQDLITSIAVSKNDAAYTFVGTFNGYVYILATKGLDYIKSFHVTDKETQEGSFSGNANIKMHHGPRVICLESYRDAVDKSLRLLVTSNDSRIRVFDAKTKKCLEIMKGFQSGSSQTNSQLTMMGNKAIVTCGSEDHWVYAWKIRAQAKSSHVQEKENDQSIKKTGLRGIFSHHKDNDNKHSKNEQHQQRRHSISHNPLHLKSFFQHASGGSNDQIIKNNYSISFHAHHAPVTTVNIAPPVTTKLLSLSNDLICELSLQFYLESDNLDIVTDRAEEKSLDNESDSASVSTSSSNPSISNHSSLLDLYKTEENAKSHEQALPNVVDAIGTIMVTTDSMGVIRVFRADLPVNIRKRVLEKLEEYRMSETNGRKYASSDSLNTLGQGSIYSANVASGTGNAQCKNNTGVVEDAFCAGVGASKRIRASSVFKNSLFNHSNASLSSLRTNRGSASSYAPEEDTVKKSPLHGAGDTRLRCDVCNGTKFGTTPMSTQTSRDAGNYCLDCGTMLNNFR